MARFLTATPPNSKNCLAWLLKRDGEIRTALTDTAKKLSSGIDVDSMPAEFAYPSSEGTLRVTVSAMKRYTAIHVSDKLQELAGMDWLLLFPSSQPRVRGNRK